MHRFTVGERETEKVGWNWCIGQKSSSIRRKKQHDERERPVGVVLGEAGVRRRRSRRSRLRPKNLSSVRSAHEDPFNFHSKRTVPKDSRCSEKHLAAQPETPVYTYTPPRDVSFLCYEKYTEETFFSPIRMKRSFFRHTPKTIVYACGRDLLLSNLVDCRKIAMYITLDFRQDGKYIQSSELLDK